MEFSKLDLDFNLGENFGKLDFDFGDLDTKTDLDNNPDLDPKHDIDLDLKSDLEASPSRELTPISEQSEEVDLVAKYGLFFTNDNDDTNILDVDKNHKNGSSEKEVKCDNDPVLTRSNSKGKCSSGNTIQAAKPDNEPVLKRSNSKGKSSNGHTDAKPDSDSIFTRLLSKRKLSSGSMNEDVERDVSAQDVKPENPIIARLKPKRKSSNENIKYSKEEAKSDNIPVTKIESRRKSSNDNIKEDTKRETDLVFEPSREKLTGHKRDSKAEDEFRFSIPDMSFDFSDIGGIMESEWKDKEDNVERSKVIE